MTPWCIQYLLKLELPTTFLSIFQILRLLQEWCGLLIVSWLLDGYKSMDVVIDWTLHSSENYQRFMGDMWALVEIGHHKDMCYDVLGIWICAKSHIQWSICMVTRLSSSTFPPFQKRSVVDNIMWSIQYGDSHKINSYARVQYVRITHVYIHIYTLAILGSIN